MYGIWYRVFKKEKSRTKNQYMIGIGTYGTWYMVFGTYMVLGIKKEKRIPKY
jgi:hypothetical protein